MTPTPRRPRGPRRPLPARRLQRRNKGRVIGRIFGTAALLTLTAASLYGGYLYRTSHVLPGLIGSFIAHKSVVDVFPHQQALNLMIIGHDRDYSDSDQILKSRGRSDMLMMAHLDFDKKTVSLLSIPRDTLAQIPGHGTTKINAAHKYGGPPLTEETVQDNFGIPSDKYVALDFDGFEKAIDILGGVDLVVDKKMDYDDNWGHLHIHLKPGMQHLNGQQAMGFVRFRHSDSDLVRTQRQQTLLAALKSKMRSPETLTKIGPLLDTIDSHLESDLSMDQKVALARFIHDTPREDVHMTTLPSREAGSNVATDWPKAGPVIQGIFGVEQGSARLAEADTDGGSHRRRHHRRSQRMAGLP